MSAHLLAIAIGPVQDFIAAGRKTRDLWFGSTLLSDVAGSAARALLAKDADMIFPTRDALAKDVAVANKLLAVCPIGTDPAALATLARDEAQAKLRAYWTNDARTGVWDTLDLDTREAIESELSLAQIGDLLEFYAAWWPLPAEADYPAVRTEVERLVAGRKALRDFAPAHGRPGRPKSALDPSRESVLFPERLVDPKVKERVHRTLHLKGTEELDAVSLIKRLSRPKRFVSTSRVALDPFIRRAVAAGGEADTLLVALRENADRLKKTELAEPFATNGMGLAHYASFPFDCQLFYRSGPADRALTDEETRTLSPQEQGAAKEFVRAAGALRGMVGGDPPAYVAVLVADGDRMGAAINLLETPVDHRAFSDELVTFAEAADGIVQRHFGALVYSGGDDVLAFLPLDTAIPCADALRRHFAVTMARALAGKAAPPPTLSVGLAIGHYAEHLQNLLAWGREAERAAKRLRNALAVRLHTRTGGGTAREVVASWDDEPAARWWQWIALHRDDAVPDGAAYDLERLRRELGGLGGPQGIAPEQLARLTRAEAGRILGRKRAEHGRRPLSDEEREKIEGLIGGDLDRLGTLVDELIIARRLVGAGALGGDAAAERWRAAVGAEVAA